MAQRQTLEARVMSGEHTDDEEGEEGEFLRELAAAPARSLPAAFVPAGSGSHPAAEFSGTERFHIVRRLGAGGMGVVYEALDRELGARVALKTLRRFSGEALFRFKNEFRAVQDIQHPNLVQLGELIEDRGQWFFTMQLVEGQSFLDYVRPQGAARAAPDFDEARLRAALEQLGRGLCALHDAGKVHRDVKPSNLLVTREGHVILLDFGLIADASDAASTDVHAVGTAAYMAPEQAAAQPVGPAADWYAVGVMMYEVLAGALPFIGAPLEILMHKQRHQPPAPRRLVAPELRERIPADLDALCVELLRFDPALRPSGVAVLRRLRVDPDEPAVHAAMTSPLPTLFVGRRRELLELRELYDRTRRGEAVSCYVHGESGGGKSALLLRFVRDLQADEPALLVLTGRCYQRESVPYNAIDGVVDALSRHLRLLPRPMVAALLPRKAALLGQVFPVLGRVEALAGSPSLQTDPLDPRELRRQVFAALRELLARIAERQPLVVVIDDLQWADADSLALLRELMHPAEAPGLLLLATVRLSPTEWRRQLAQAGGLEMGAFQRLTLGPLSLDETRELAMRLAERLAPGRRVDASSLAHEAKGQPLFVQELVRYLTATGDGGTDPAAIPPPAPVRLEDALWSRIARLDKAEQRLLEMVVMAAGPMLQDVVAQAAGIEPAEFVRHTSLLRVANLVRQSGPRGPDTTIEPFHDRVRGTVIAHLDAETQRHHHLALAQALETSGRGDPESLARHFHAVGDIQRTARYSIVAAEKAAAALAFERAAALYRQAAEVVAASSLEEARALHVKRGDALAHAGRGAEAARVYLVAAEGAGAAEALHLRRSAATLLLITGHIDEGGAMLKALLDSEGIAYPQTPVRALARILWNRLQLRLRGLDFQLRDASQVAPRDLARIDMCWAVGVGLSLVDALRGRVLQTEALVLALRAGEPYRLAGLLALESGYRAAEGGGRALQKVWSILETARGLADRAGDPRALIFVMLAHAPSNFLTGRFQQALEAARAAEGLWRKRGVGVGWTLSTCGLWETRSLQWLGRFAELATRLPELVREFQERGDLYGATNLRTAVAPFLRFAADDPEGARREMDDALQKWSVAGFRTQHYWVLLHLVAADLYQGQGREAYARLIGRWPEIVRALLLRVQFFRIEAWDVRGRAALAAAAVPGADRERLLREAERSAARVAREKMPCSNALGRLLIAGVAAARGQDVRAVSLYAAAGHDFDLLQMGLHAAAAHRRQGELIQGDSGRALVADSDAWMVRQKIRDPERMAAMLAPAVPAPRRLLLAPPMQAGLLRLKVRR